MQAIERSDVQYTPGLFRHLDQCLHCSSCEAMCPSRVPFSRLMDTARVAIEPHRKRSLANNTLRRTALRLVASPAWTRTLAVLLTIHQKLGLQRLIDQAPGLPAAVKRLNRLLPMRQIDSPAERAPIMERRGVVNLFVGCAGYLFDRQTLNAAQRLLEGLGYQVVVPAQQGCCGALHQHNGDPATAARLMERNRMAFSANDHPIVVTASGCAAHLTDARLACRHGPADHFAQRVTDIVHFLHFRRGAELRFQPLEETVAVHIPCTHRNVLGQHQDTLDILKRIPGIETLLINPDGGCCGAAGSFMITQAELSERLRRPLIDTLVHSGVRLLLTTNIGCALQLRAGLKERGLGIDVQHPVVLLDRLLQPGLPTPLTTKDTKE